MDWVCERCGTLHTETPSKCRKCGRTAFRLARDGDRPSEHSQGPEAVDTDRSQTYGTTPEPEYDSSPDVAVDGSVDAPEEPGEEPPAQQKSRIRNWLGRSRRKIGPTLRAPIGLFRELLIPILAFLVVIFTVWWLFS